MNNNIQKTILLVEDEIIIAMDQSQTIKGFGCYDVIIANNGEKAIERALNNENISLVLMDVDLGKGLDGPQAAQKILEKRNIPIVFLTSHSEKEFVNSVKEITRYGYVIKNSGDFVLQTSIEMAFELHEARKISEEKAEYFNVTLQSIGDAVIATDINGYITLMNNTAERLTGWSFAEAENRPVTDVLKILNSETYSIVDNPVKLVIDKGKTVGLANHTVLVSRNGNKYQISDSAAPIRDKENNIYGVILVFSDVTEKYNAEVEREQYFKLFQNSFDLMCIADAGGTFLKLNPAFIKTLGYSEAELIAKPYVNFIHPDDKQLTLDEMASQQQKGFTFNFENRYMCKDGTFRWLSWRAIFNKDEGLTYATASDITERKQAEAEREQYFKLFQTSSDLMCMADPNGAFKKTNPAFTQTLGYSEEELIAKPFIEFVHPDDKQSTLDEMARQQQKGSSLNFENRYICKDGSFRWLSWRAIFNKDDGTTYATARDITENMQMEVSLRERESLIRSINNHFTNGMIYQVVIKPDGARIFTYLSDSVKQLYGISPEEAMADSKMIYSKIHEDDIEFLIKTENEAVKKLSAFKAEVRVKEPSGKIRWSSYISTPKKMEDGSMCFDGIEFIITERKLAEEKIQNLLHEKDLILKEVHHRIKNNMNTMTSLLNLQSKTQDNPETKNILQDAAGRIRSMMVLYDKLYRSGNIRTISVKEYFSSLINEIVNLFPKKGQIKIQTQIDDIILGVDILSSLGIILNELITNAMKYAFSGRDKGVISIIVSNKENGVLIIFEDNGIGIPESVSIENSTGFGLQLIGLLAGQINASIKLERQNGTRFIILINSY